MQKIYTASEAIQKLGIPAPAFYAMVNRGEITKIVRPGGKRAKYSREEIDALATKMEEYRQKVS